MTVFRGFKGANCSYVFTLQDTLWRVDAGMPTSCPCQRCVFLGGVFFRTFVYVYASVSREYLHKAKRVTFWRINHSFFGYWRVNRFFFGYIEPRYIHKILWRVNRFFSGILNSDLYDFLSLIFKCTHSSAELIYPGMTNVIFSQSIVINPMLVRLVVSCPAHHTLTVDESQIGA